mgnify:CR=1 FL=1
MPPLDATQLPDLPAPFWFIQFFKVLGFLLHMVPMNLWYAGVPLAVAFYFFGGEHARQWSRRLMLQMPILVAAGINLGIVPLLFLQVAYAKAFYPATILMAWFWLSVIVLLIPAYYGVYIYASGMRNGPTAMTPLKRAAGWCSAVMFLAIGFIFANAMSLTTNPSAWPDLLDRHGVAGAALGTALNVADPSLWPRWLLMLGLALITTAAWTALDTVWLAAQESEEYRRWGQAGALRLALAGAIWSTVTGAWYLFGTWRPSVFGEMFAFPAILLTLLTAASCWAPAALLWIVRQKDLNRQNALAVAGAQVAVLALNAISRQIVQNIELREVFQPGVSAQPSSPDWGPMAMFLIVFVAGVGVLAWLFAQLAKAGPATNQQAPSEPTGI